MTDSNVGKDTSFRLDFPEISVPEDLRTAPDGFKFRTPFEIDEFTLDEAKNYNMELINKRDTSPDFLYASNRYEQYIAARQNPPGEIVVSDPATTDSPWNQFGKDKTPEEIAIIQEKLESVGCTAESCPKTADLGAGAAPFQDLVLKPKGWKAENMVNIDMVIPYTNPIPGSKWLAWNLDALSKKIAGRFEIPPEVEKYKGTFDLVSMTTGLAPLVSCFNLPAEFLLRKGGYLYADGMASAFLGDTNVWQDLGDGVWQKK